MSDLSRLLDDVYGTSGPSGTTETAEVLTSWDQDAPPDIQVVTDPVAALEAIFDLGPVERTPAPEPLGPEIAEPEPTVPEAVATPDPEPASQLLGRPWEPSDDDILPTRSSRRRFTLRRR